MNQAQGAIDAAKAAGADRYAPTDLSAATDALRGAEDAVTARDYRLALSLAIESRDRAQHAAKAAGEAHARTRGDAERLIAEASTLLAQARARLRDPIVNRLPPRGCRNNAPSSSAPNSHCKKHAQPSKRTITPAHGRPSRASPRKFRPQVADRSDRRESRVEPAPVGGTHPQIAASARSSRPESRARTATRFARRFTHGHNTLWGYPRSFENDFRPTGQIDAVVAPLDALRAARRDDVEVARGASVRDGGHR